MLFAGMNRNVKDRLGKDTEIASGLALEGVCDWTWGSVRSQWLVL